MSDECHGALDLSAESLDFTHGFSWTLHSVPLQSLDDFIHIFETMKTSILLYHGSSVPVEHPEIRKSVYTKDFIAQCRSGHHHNYDIVEGPMADDSIWNFVNGYLAGDIPQSVFLEFARFRHPTHQVSFHTPRALACLTFLRCEEVL